MLLLLNSAEACINSYQEEVTRLLAQRDKPALAEIDVELKVLQAKYQTDPNDQLGNDIAVLYLLRGDYQKSIQLLKKVEAAQPNMARTAANLGTAYELAGNNQKALHWIKQGVIRDPNEHQGSEWLHVAILEAKIALETDRKWLTRNHVLALDFGMGQQPNQPPKLPMDFQGKPYSLEQTFAAISYQLQERMKFVPPPDPVVADLQLTMAEIAWLLENTEYLVEYYQVALQYGAKPTSFVNSRITEASATSALKNGV